MKSPFYSIFTDTFYRKVNPKVIYFPLARFLTLHSSFNQWEQNREAQGQIKWNKLNYRRARFEDSIRISTVFLLETV